MKKKERAISILLVEDVDEMRSLMEHVLEGIPGIHVSGAAKNSFEARIEVSRRRPDLILLDEILPGESSQDLLKEWTDSEIKVILMTSLENPSPSLPKGALGRIVKPGWKSVEEDRERIRETIFKQISGTDA